MRRYFAATLTLGLLVTVWLVIRPRNESDERSLLVAGQAIVSPAPHHVSPAPHHVSPAPHHVSPAPHQRVGQMDVQLRANHQTTTLEAKPDVNTPADASSSLTVRVSGLRPRGDVLVAVFEKASGFPNRDNAARTCKALVTDKDTHIRFQDLPPGDYAVAIFQDLNDDGILNKGAFGVPSEPYGFSNNARGSFGPPSFQAASFSVALGGKDVDVTVR